MKKYLLLAVLMPLLSFKTTWLPVNMDDHVTVSFPSMPELRQLHGGSVWVNSTEQCLLMATMIDFTGWGIETSRINAELEEGETLVNFSEKFLSRIQNARLVSERKFEVSGNAVFEIVADIENSDPAMPSRLYSRNYFVNDKMYSLSFYEYAGHPQDELREIYFSSFSMH